MKAYQVVENGKPLEEKEMETPVPKGKEILLKTVSCGVCHSDVHIHDGYFDYIVYNSGSILNCF